MEVDLSYNITGSGVITTQEAYIYCTCLFPCTFKSKTLNSILKIQFKKPNNIHI